MRRRRILDRAPAIAGRRRCRPAPPPRAVPRWWRIPPSHNSRGPTARRHPPPSGWCGEFLCARANACFGARRQTTGWWPAAPQRGQRPPATKCRETLRPRMVFDSGMMRSIRSCYRGGLIYTRQVRISWNFLRLGPVGGRFAAAGGLWRHQRVARAFRRWTFFCPASSRLIRRQTNAPVVCRA